ncbi:branched-chain amino acid ABC transporter permease [Catellatospora citrea]|uniref:branched-chain amino acid ABC transporter permease n=1 Tax=Catellatospora citrea TaxID=53366 RepID=UPI0033E14D22
MGAYLVSAVDGVTFGMLYFTLAAGLTLIFGLMDMLNLAHGTCYLLGAGTAALVADGTLAGLARAVAAGLGAGVLVGLLLTALSQPLARRGHLDQALLTLGLSLLGAEAYLLVSGGDPLPAAPPAALAGSVGLFGHAYPVYRLVFVAVAAVLALGIHLAVERTRGGALVRAIVADRDMARAMGVDTRRVFAVVLVGGSALAVLGGVLGAPILGPGPGVDEHVLLMSLAVVVLGGLGSVRGALLAALLVGQVETLGRTLVPAFASFLLFAVMAAVLAVRARGGVPAGRAA